MYGHKPTMDLLGGQRSVRGSPLLSSRGEKVAWNRLMSLVFGVTSFLLLFGFLSKGRALGVANEEVASLRQQLSRAEREVSQCRTNLNYLEQDVANKETAARALRSEVSHYREQSDRQDNVLQGYRGQVHNLEVKLGKTEEDCKKREEELEALVAQGKTEKKAVEKQVQDQIAIVQQVTVEKDSVVRSLSETTTNLNRWKDAYLALTTPPTAVPVPQPQPVPVPVPQPQAVPVPQPQAVPVPQPQAVPVPQPQAVPVPQPQAVPVPQPQAVPVPQPQAVPTPANPTPQQQPPAEAAQTPPTEQHARRELSNDPAVQAAPVQPNVA